MKERTDRNDRLGRYFPDEFPKRLERLKDLAGVSWEELAEILGVSHRRMMRWRRGGKPSGGGFWAVFVLGGAGARRHGCDAAEAIRDPDPGGVGTWVASGGSTT